MRVVVTQLIVFLLALSTGAEEENLELHFHLTPDDEAAAKASDETKKDVAAYGMKGWIIQQLSLCLTVSSSINSLMTFDILHVICDM